MTWTVTDPECPAEVLAVAALDDDWHVRQAAMEHPNAPADVVADRAINDEVESVHPLDVEL